jgi:hypothetical protein
MQRFILFVFIFLNCFVFSQKLDSTEINGVKYYIYPYPQQARMANVLETMLYSDFKSIIRQTNPELSKKEIKKIVKEYNKLGGNLTVFSKKEKAKIANAQTKDKEAKRKASDEIKKLRARGASPQEIQAATEKLQNIINSTIVYTTRGGKTKRKRRRRTPRKRTSRMKSR